MTAATAQPVLPAPAPAPVERFVRRPYQERAARYRVAADRLATGGLSDRHSLADVGAGHTELDWCLRREHGWDGRYLPFDRWTGDVDLERWVPPMRYDWLACLEVIEHLRDPDRLLRELLASAVLGVVVTTPNPAVVDVLAMDPTHITPVSREHLADLGFYTSLHNLYGTPDDGICGVWYREGLHLVERKITPVRYIPATAERSGR
ncbi:hypothetical protein [Streptomyces sp. G-G2]|uniref:hypothetical protein n=1 Tax=Streptomyces sp. G-G2 TaxID=3046201 RepID=UPI0024BBB754|nr:hypothetical protein [Streptomyces sp. G-G2]MDJ0386283.1 hypothetical protein [Streptomyces sp. G-G2]